MTLFVLLEVATSLLRNMFMFVAPEPVSSLSQIYSLGFLKPGAKSYFNPCYPEL